MLKRTALSLLGASLVISCATVNAKQSVTLEPIEHLAPAASLTDAGEEDLRAFETQGSPVENAVVGGSAQRHLGKVLVLAPLPEERGFYSGDALGFITRHSDAGGDTWQVSDLGIRKIAVRPGGNLLAVYESDGFSIHRVSLWNWTEKRRVFAKRFKDSVLSLAWSAKGTWLLVGNSSIEGITALDPETGNPVPLFKSPPGMVSLAVTGKSETSVMTFGPSGRLLYTDTASGTPRADYQGPQDMLTPLPLGNNRYIAGILDSSVLLVDATTGKTAAQWSVSTAPLFLAASEGSSTPLWIESTEDEEYVLRSGDSVTESFTFPDKDQPSSAAVIDGRLIVGTPTGSLYAGPASFVPGDTVTWETVDSAPVRRIDDVASDDSRLFILSAGTLLVSAGPGKAPLFSFDGIQGNRLAFSGGSLITWSDQQAFPVTRYDLDGQNPQVLYHGSDAITSLSAADGKIALVEANARVVVLRDGAEPFVYQGIGIQDALCLEGSSLIVTKSATPRSPYPVVKIDTDTGETVPFSIQGNLCYGIKPIEGAVSGFTGFLVTDTPSGTETRLVTVTGLDSNAGSAPPVRVDATYADEDLSAWVACEGSVRYTNLGKGSAVGIDPVKGIVRRYPRGYALPKRIVLTSRYIATVNKDGSLSWIERSSGNLAITASITMDGYWKEE